MGLIELLCISCKNVLVQHYKCKINMKLINYKHFSPAFLLLLVLDGLVRLSLARLDDAIRIIKSNSDSYFPSFGG